MTQREILNYARMGALEGMRLFKEEKEYVAYKAAFEEIEMMIDRMELEGIFYSSHGYLPSDEDMEEMRKRYS